jgi:hypothetical protein
MGLEVGQSARVDVLETSVGWKKIPCFVRIGQNC